MPSDSPFKGQGLQAQNTPVTGKSFLNQRKSWTNMAKRRVSIFHEWHEGTLMRVQEARTRLLFTANRTPGCGPRRSHHAGVDPRTEHPREGRPATTLT
eukprot:12536922-Alexandrium_andersonii.AAC.1